MTHIPDASRRALLKTGLFAPALLLAGRPLLAGGPQEQEGGEQDVSTVEDLMREHGILRRVLLIYEEAIRRVDQKADVPTAAIASAADLVRKFVEDYHEKLEEDYLFPRFRKAGTLADLVKVLEEQHKKGRTLTSEIQKMASAGTKSAQDRDRLKAQMALFIRMYRPHAAREDTVLFPAFKELVSPKEYDALGDEFEKKEQALFGEDGFEKNVDAVGQLEKEIGINDLAQFTPKV